MKAISTRFGIADAVAMALRAGADMAVWSDDGGATPSTASVNRLLDRLESEVHTGRLAEPTVNAAVARVLAAKGTNGCDPG
jgi:beta-N-acetylhexosaminidase